MDSVASRFQRSVMMLNRNFGVELMKHLDSGVTGPQMFVLHFIGENGRCRVTELAEMLEVKPSAVTVMIDRLVKSGYVVRSSDDADRRVILVELTEAGRKILLQAKAIRRKIIESYMSSLTPEESKTVTELLEKMTAASQALAAGE